MRTETGGNGVRTVRDWRFEPLVSTLAPPAQLQHRPSAPKNPPSPRPSPMDNSSPPRLPNPLSFYNTALEVNSSSAQAAADPSPHDPSAVFIHPPFTDFPDSDLHPDGLTFAILAANPDWFLDPGDFVSPANGGGPPSKSDAVQYPAKLEPPRKRNLKALGADGLTDNGEPRFRCTFCRKSYAGDNAKSMWRRHVVKRHYIAMSNRREVKRGFRLGPRRGGANGALLCPRHVISAIYKIFSACS